MRKCLITGVAGFLGRSFADFFSARGISVYGTDRAEPSNVSNLSLTDYRKFNLPDGTFAKWLGEIKPDLLIHAAGKASVAQSMYDPKADYFSGPPVTFALLDSVRLRSPATKVIFLSSAAVYGNPKHLPISEEAICKPISPYGFHKLQCELCVKEYSEVFEIQALSLRIFSAYGDGLRKQFLWDFCMKAASLKEFSLMGSGEETRDFLHVHDICRAVELVNNKANFVGESINVCSSIAKTIREISNELKCHFPNLQRFYFDGVTPSGVPLKWQGYSSFLEREKFVPLIPLNMGVASYVKWFHEQDINHFNKLSK